MEVRMTRMLSLVGVLSIAVIALSGAARAQTLDNQDLPYNRNVAAAPVAQANPASTAPWHYELQYHYGHHADYVPAWVAVPNSAR